MKFRIQLCFFCLVFFLICALHFSAQAQSDNIITGYVINSERRSLADLNIERTELFLNGQPRFRAESGTYFNRVESFYHHYRRPPTGIDCYSFAIRPEDHQPSGTCNMSKIDYVNLNFRLDPIVSSQNQVNVRVYSVNYNVLRIFYGLGAVAFK